MLEHYRHLLYSSSSPIIIMHSKCCVRYRIVQKCWREKTLANLAIAHRFAKVFPSKYNSRVIMPRFHLANVLRYKVTIPFSLSTPKSGKTRPGYGRLLSSQATYASKLTSLEAALGSIRNQNSTILLLNTYISYLGILYITIFHLQ